MTLYELEDYYKYILDLMEDEDASEQAINDTMQLILENIAEKADGYCKVLKQLQADAEALKLEKMRLAKRQAVIENNLDRLRAALLGAMLLTGQKKIKTALFTLSTTTRLKTVLDSPEEDIPKEFQKVTVKADTKAIDEWLRAGHEVPWAHQEQVQTLTVR